MEDELEEELEEESDSGSNEDLENTKPSEAVIQSEPDQVDGLAEHLVRLSCTFWMDTSTIGIVAHLPIVYFSSVLRIQPEGLAWQVPYAYTPILAGLVYIGRLLMLEYALPQYSYQLPDWPSRYHCPDQLDQLQLVCKRYLCRGTSHSMSRILELLYIGQAITNKEGCQANVSWSIDSQVLTLRLHSSQPQFQISQFRTMV